MLQWLKARISWNYFFGKPVCYFSKRFLIDEMKELSTDSRGRMFNGYNPKQQTKQKMEKN